MLASQLGAPISYISEQQGSDLLAIKKRLGLPDVRFDASRMKECQLSDLEVPGSIALTPTPCDGCAHSDRCAALRRMLASRRHRRASRCCCAHDFQVPFKSSPA